MRGVQNELRDHKGKRDFWQRRMGEGTVGTMSGKGLALEIPTSLLGDRGCMKGGEENQSLMGQALTRSRPSSLALYMAWSAADKRSSSVERGSPRQATP